MFQCISFLCEDKDIGRFSYLQKRTFNILQSRSFALIFSNISKVKLEKNQGHFFKEIHVALDHIEETFPRICPNLNSKLFSQI